MGGTLGTAGLDTKGTSPGLGEAVGAGVVVGAGVATGTGTTFVGGMMGGEAAGGVGAMQLATEGWLKKRLADAAASAWAEAEVPPHDVTVALAVE